MSIIKVLHISQELKDVLWLEEENRGICYDFKGGRFNPVLDSGNTRLVDDGSGSMVHETDEDGNLTGTDRKWFISFQERDLTAEAALKSQLGDLLGSDTYNQIKGIGGYDPLEEMDHRGVITSL